jgi:hypothetical protein
VADSRVFPLRVVDGLRLDRSVREALLPGRVMRDDNGIPRQLPRYFYEIPAWDDALRIQLGPSFGLWEFIQTDVREADALRAFPRYVPCAITTLALCLEQFRNAVGTFVHIAANGGYRSPRHALTGNASPHCWATAVNVYRIGDVFLDDRESIERFGAVARSVLPGAWTRPYGEDRGSTDDHLHIDFGYLLSVPRDAPVDPVGIVTTGDAA